MSLLISTALTSTSGFSVPSGTYCWLQERRGTDRKYKIEVDVFFFKDSTAFSGGKSRYFPSEIPADKHHFEQEFSPQAFATITSTDVHNFVRQELSQYVGGLANISIVQ